DCPLNSRFVRPAPSTATLSLPGAASSLLKARPRVGCVSRTSKRFGDTSAAVTRRAPAAVERFAAPTDSALTPVKVWRMACQSVTSNASFGAFGTAGAYELSSSTKRDECGNGKGRKNAACASAYVDARAPVPTASDRIARTDNVGARRSERMPYRRSPTPGLIPVPPSQAWPGHTPFVTLVMPVHGRDVGARPDDEPSA